MSVYKKIFEAKKEIGRITKDSKNPFFKSNYLSLNGLLDAVEGVFEKNGLVILQPIEDGKVKTQIIDVDEGKTSILQSEMNLPNIQDPQKLGSAITYFRRYTLQSLLGLQAEDDDGNTATNHIKKPKPITEIEYKELEKGLNIAKTREDITVLYNSDTRYKTDAKAIEMIKSKNKELQEQ